MKAFKIFAVLALLLALCGVPLQAQTTTTQTTLSSAITTTSATQIVVTSNSGFISTAAATATSPAWAILIDNEFMAVRSISGTTIVNVLRGQAGTKTATHAAGAVVWAGPTGASGPFITNAIAGYAARTGSCTALNELYLPQLAIVSADQYDCVNSRWVRRLLGGPPLDPSSASAPILINRFCSVPIGSVAYGSMGTSTTPVSGTTYWTTVYVPYSMLATGVSVLNAATVGTNKWDVALYAYTGGAALTTSAAAGATTAGADAFQDVAFSATFYVPGPAYYFLAAQMNGTTDRFRTIAASTFNNVLTSSTTGTFATWPSLTAPTTFTADKGVISCLY